MYKNYAMWQQEAQEIDSILDGLSANIESGQSGHIDNHKRINQFMTGVWPDMEIMVQNPLSDLRKGPDGWILVTEQAIVNLTPEQVVQFITHYPSFPAIVQDGLTEAIEYESVDDIPVNSKICLVYFHEGVSAILKTAYGLGVQANLQLSNLHSDISDAANFDNMLVEILKQYCTTQRHERDPDTNQFVPPLPSSSNPNYLGVTYYKKGISQISFIRALHKSTMSESATVATSYILKPVIAESRVSGLETNVSTLTSANSTLEGKVLALENDDSVSALEGQVATLTTSNSTLSDKVSTLESDSATLNTTVSQLGEDVTTLSNANSTLEGQVSTLESDNVSLNTTVSGLETDFGSLSSANDTLSSTVSTLEGNVTTLTSDKEALEGQVSTLESTIADLTSRLEALETPGGEV